MKKLFSEILGTRVMTENGETIAIIFDVLIDPDNGSVVAFSVLFGFRRVIIPLDIREWFREVIVSDADVIVDPFEVIRVKKILERNIFFLKNRVYSKNGRYLGRVFDLEIDLEQMFLIKIFVAKNFLGFVHFDERIIAFSDIIEVHADRIIVKNDAGFEKVVNRKTEMVAG